MPSDEQWLAEVRPPISWDDLYAALKGPGLKSIRRVRGTTFDWGSTADSEPDGVNRRQQLQQITFRPPFDPTVAIAGFHLGAQRIEALPLVKALGLSGADELIEAERQRRAGESTESQKITCLGQTTDGHDLKVVIGDEVVEVAIAVRGFRAYREQCFALRQELATAAAARRVRADRWKSITDDDDRMLDEWAAHCRPWADSAESEFVKFAEWLKRASPDERHAAAHWCNWDYGLAPLFWIVRRPDCDLATAVYVLFACEPFYFMERLIEDGRLPKTSDHESLPLLLEVKSRIERAAYTRAEIGYDVTRALAFIERLHPTAAQRQAVLPHNLRTVHTGRQIDEKNGFAGIRHPGFAIN